MELVNLTPHPIVVRRPEGDVTIPPSGQVARVSATYAEVGAVGDIPIVAQQFGDVEGLPDPAPDTYYIVSGLVRAALGPERPDVLAPDTGAGAIRDDQGRIVAVTRLVGVAG